MSSCRISSPKREKKTEPSTWCETDAPQNDAAKDARVVCDVLLLHFVVGTSLWDLGGADGCAQDVTGSQQGFLVVEILISMFALLLYIIVYSRHMQNQGW